MSRHILGRVLPFIIILLTAVCVGSAAEPELVDIRTVDPTILVELRYAGSHNCAGKALYPQNMPALARPEVARRLAEAQATLRPLGYRLKIWDAYRPKSAHQQLWQFSPFNDYVADPSTGGSLHSWGVAIDATLVDSKGRELKMPTDFDDFSDAAMLRYTGTNQTVRRNLIALQSAMARAGFYGMRTEWWHFVSKDWKDYRSVPEAFLGATSSLPPPLWSEQRPPLPAPPAARPAGPGSSQSIATRR
ncbi:MAG: M15 family metallopeptidase [Chthoniobacterales bacterium]